MPLILNKSSLQLVVGWPGQQSYSQPWWCSHSHTPCHQLRQDSRENRKFSPQFNTRKWKGNLEEKKQCRNSHRFPQADRYPASLSDRDLWSSHHHCHPPIFFLCLQFMLPSTTLQIHVHIPLSPFQVTCPSCVSSEAHDHPTGGVKAGKEKASTPQSPGTAKTLVCYQRCFSHESRTQEDVGCHEES